MSQTTVSMRSVAKRLFNYEQQQVQARGPAKAETLHVCEKLRPHVVTFTGRDGFNALYARAIMLASTEIPWLRGVQIIADGSLAGLQEVAGKESREKIAEGKIALIAQLLALMVKLIGEGLMMNLVRGIWPHVALQA